MTSPGSAGAAGAPEPFVSTGSLPASDRVHALVQLAYRHFADDHTGDVSRVYPALSAAPPDLFGVCVVSTAGQVYPAGDAGVEFTVMSVAKPFVFALVCEAAGADRVRRRVGVNATGLPFNSLAAIERAPDGRTNPMVNPGAIATTSMTPGRTPEARWQLLRHGLSRFAGRQLDLDEAMFASASAANRRNQAMAQLLASLDLLGCDPAEAVDLYTRQSCLRVRATDLAAMGATLADGGVNPITGHRVVDARTCHDTLAVMMTAGLYESLGDWLYDIGGKSGIGGGIVTVAPGKGGLGTFAPRLDAAGNSVKGQHAARFLSQHLGLDLFASSPA